MSCISILYKICFYITASLVNKCSSPETAAQPRKQNKLLSRSTFTFSAQLWWLLSFPAHSAFLGDAPQKSSLSPGLLTCSKFLLYSAPTPPLGLRAQPSPVPALPQRARTTLVLACCCGRNPFWLWGSVLKDKASCWELAAFPDEQQSEFIQK